MFSVPSELRINGENGLSRKLLFFILFSAFFSVSKLKLDVQFVLDILCL